LNRNERSHWSGNGVHVESELVFMIGRNMHLREIEKTKIKCARKFFDGMNRRCAPENVKYDVVDSFGKLMEVVK
ncbi:hypothetical protein, partial [Aeromonas caviae]|uniref:hypothetical protein n=1 Tax=Aeromonas caviae TaxID=648 RepID=UPI001E36A0F9